jgi:uncharacterized membrane protein YbhN (UPF0104 family)
VVAAALPFANDLAARRQLTTVVVVVFALCAVAAAVIYSERAAGWVRRTAAVIPVKVLHRVTDALTDAVRRYATHHGELTRVLAMSILVQVIRVLQGWCLGRALGLELPLLTYFVFIPIIVLVMQLPITVNGIGTTQVVFHELFVRQGAPAPQVFAFSVLFLALGIVGTLPGGVLYALGSPATREQERRGARGPHGPESHGTHGT